MREHEQRCVYGCRPAKARAILPLPLPSVESAPLVEMIDPSIIAFDRGSRPKRVSSNEGARLMPRLARQKTVVHFALGNFTA